MGIDRKQALFQLRYYIKSEKTIIHSLAAEAVMRALARRLEEDEDVGDLIRYITSFIEIGVPTLIAVHRENNPNGDG